MSVAKANADGPLSDFSCAAVVDVSEVELARQSIRERRLPSHCLSCVAAHLVGVGVGVVAIRVPKIRKRFLLNLSEKLRVFFCNAPFSSFHFHRPFRARLRVSEEEERVRRPSGGAAKDVFYLSHHRHRGSANQRPRLLRHFILLKGDQTEEPHGLLLGFQSLHVFRCTGLGCKDVLRFGEYCSCFCLPLLPQLPCSILGTWERPFIFKLCIR